MANHNPFRFTVDGALLGELGEKLVTTVHVALSELVKNAYDADAKRVTVRILPEDGAPRIVVQDDGLGMSPDDVRRFWMKIGTTNKASAPLSAKYGRLKTGSKGIGRFASRRLGRMLLLKTTAVVKQSPRGPNKYQTTTISFDWSDFPAGVNVEDVQCFGETIVEAQGETGTTLEIWGGIIDEWQTRGFNYLQRQLAILASNRGTARPGYKEDPGFNVILEAPGLFGQPIDIRDAIIEASWGTLRADVRGDGRAVCTLNAKGLGGTKKFTSSDLFKQIPGASLFVGILPSKRDEARKPNILADYVLSDIIEEWGGIHVRFNGFRVYPYGDPGDDWLRIDADRGRRIGKPDGELFDFAARLDRVDAARALLNMLGMRNYLGHVEVTSTSIPSLIVRIDRQGFLDTPVFEELRRFARFVIDWANINRDYYIRLREHEETERAREKIRPVLDLDGPKEEIVPKATSFLRREFKRLVERLPDKQKKETEQTLVRTIHAIEAVTTENRKQLEHLRLVASASTLTLLFAHEVRTVIGTLGAASLRLEQLSHAIPSHGKALKALAGQLRENKKRFDNLLGMTGIVSAFRETATLAQIHLRGAIERAVRCFEQVIADYQISVDDADVPPDITLGPIIEGELYTILLNLFSNAFKSLVASGESQKTIRVEAKRTGKKVTIRIMDNGLGLDEAFYEQVFTPFISDPSGELYDRLQERANPEDTSLLGTGSGLGLAIARDIARSRSGDVKFVSPPALWKACVEVELT